MLQKTNTPGTLADSEEDVVMDDSDSLSSNESSKPEIPCVQLYTCLIHLLHSCARINCTAALGSPQTGRWTGRRTTSCEAAPTAKAKAAAMAKAAVTAKAAVNKAATGKASRDAA